MFSMLSQIVFMQPIILSVLLALPALWYLLRITPPAPQRIRFPAARFFESLMAEEQTPSKTPWWILALRILMAALLIIALAKPVFNPAEALQGSGSIRIIIDTGWASAQTWEQQIAAGEELILQAEREKREIYIIPTTRNTLETQYQQFGPLSGGEALAVLKGLEPHPWPANYALLSNFIDNQDTQTGQTYWLSHGLDEGAAVTLFDAFKKDSATLIKIPSKESTPILLRPSDNTAKIINKEDISDIRIDIETPTSIADNTPAILHALGGNGEILDVQTVSLSRSQQRQTANFVIPENLKTTISKFRIQGRKGAGALFILDDQFKKRNVGIAASEQANKTSPLIDASYYITRALEPYANITISDINTLLTNENDVLILPDIAAIPTETLNKLTAWIQDGGLLLRFSGPTMAENNGEQFLLPVRLRAGGRSLSGSLSWEDPQNIKAFAENSPFYGLTVPDDVTVKQQVLADPAQDLENKIWARLEDGTPFITASGEGKGLIVLIHTTANTEWSDFALSGLYVTILKRVMQLSGQSAASVNTSYQSLDPLLVMDGFGNLSTPSAGVSPLPAEQLDKAIPSSDHPPGLYGRGETQYALNIGTNLPALKPLSSALPVSANINTYKDNYEVDLMPSLFYAALMLFCLDWIVMMFVGGGLVARLQKLIPSKALYFLFAIILFGSQTAHAQTSQNDLKYAQGFYLAYFITGDASLDNTSQKGLEALSEILTRRTSVEPEGVVGLNAEKDTLAFFPLIYWPIGSNQRDLSNEAIQNIQYYLDHGGTILFDTRDQNRSTGHFNDTANARVLREITASLNIPPLTPIQNDHVLGRSFYLLKEFPGRFSDGTFWVEENSLTGRDGVSSVMIGSNDWASEWANATPSQPYRAYQRGNERQTELSLRFGVNLVMYALTGNYKADQVHIPHILERLGQ
ncbi:MAG: DUF4159 domain-containing protein [Alphaproteobacteria bacterium]|nr:DUF4159 domain-containing protein [Alphaproteobacteria bacterium]